jgi:hypothetical protein
LTDHAGWVAAGLWLISSAPEKSVARQRVREGHEMPYSPLIASIRWLLHDCGSVGSVEVITSPSELSALSTAAQKDGDAHETDVKSAEQSSSGPYLPHSSGTDVPTGTRLQASAPPVGSVDTSSVPAPAAATHNDTDGHDTDDTDRALTCVALQVAVPPGGSFELTIWSPPTSTHNDAEGHDNPAGTERSSGGLANSFQLEAPEPGSVETKMEPPPAATHNDDEAHESVSSTPAEPLGAESISPSRPHDNPVDPAAYAEAAHTAAASSTTAETRPHLTTRPR